MKRFILLSLLIGLFLSCGGNSEPLPTPTLTPTPQEELYWIYVDFVFEQMHDIPDASNLIDHHFPSAQNMLFIELFNIYSTYWDELDYHEIDPFNTVPFCAQSIMGLSVLVEMERQETIADSVGYVDLMLDILEDQDRNTKMLPQNQGRYDPELCGSFLAEEGITLEELLDDLLATLEAGPNPDNRFRGLLD